MGSSPSLVSNKKDSSISLKSNSISYKKQNYQFYNRNVESILKLDTQSTSSTNITSPCETPLLSHTNSSSNLNHENSYFYHMPLTPTPYSPKHTLPHLPVIKSEEDFELIMQNQYGLTQTFKITPENYLLAHLNNRLHHNNRSNQISRNSSISESDSNDVCCTSGRVSIPLTRNNSISSVFENEMNSNNNVNDYGFSIESIQEESYYCNLCNKTFFEEGLFFNHVEYSKIHHIAVLELRSRS